MIAHPNTEMIFKALEETWPPEERLELGPVTLRRGAGGSSSAATVTGGGASMADLDRANAQMRAWGQPALYQIRPATLTLDDQLGQAGFHEKDRSVIYLGACVDLTGIEGGPVSAIRVDAPIAVMADIWQQAGTGAEQLAVMARGAGPKTYLLGRQDDKPLGVVFAATAGDICFVHALQVVPEMRRRGVAAGLIGGVAAWAGEQGVPLLAAVVPSANAGACALFDALGFSPCCHFHYRFRELP